MHPPGNTEINNDRGWVIVRAIVWSSVALVAAGWCWLIFHLIFSPS